MSTRLTNKELEQVCLEENIILERKDILTDKSFFVPNMEKLRIMIKEFEFLVDGAARGRAINEISQVEMSMQAHEGKPELQNKMLAFAYSDTSIYLEQKQKLISDRNSENWPNIFMQYFGLQDIYRYFRKEKGASNFFRNYKIFHELVELGYRIRFMEYLKDQVEVFLAPGEEQFSHYRIDSPEMSMLILHRLGFLDSLKSRMKEHYLNHGARLLHSMFCKSGTSWKQISEILSDIENNDEDSVLNNQVLNDQLKEILFQYKLDLRKE